MDTLKLSEEPPKNWPAGTGTSPAAGETDSKVGSVAACLACADTISRRPVRRLFPFYGANARMVE